jgi:5-epimerase
MSEQARPLAVLGAFAFTTTAFPDERGVFLSPYRRSVFEEALGHPLFPVAQASCSVSRRGVVRGVHFTVTPPGCLKYVYCSRGSALDIVVDTRVGSPTFGVHDSVVLGGEGLPAVYFPVGVGHLFVTLEDDTVVNYLLSQEYQQENELAVSAFDPELALPIPPDAGLLSERDRRAPTLAEARATGMLPDYEVCVRAT